MRIHIKILANPSNYAIDEVITVMKNLYKTKNIDVEVVTEENLNIPNLMDVEIEGCIRGGIITSEQTQLYENYNNVKPREIVVYFVRSIIPPNSGCAVHPPNKPGCIISSTSSIWTLAHEIGHVFGLGHVFDLDRLMTRRGTHRITNPPPDIIDEEASIVTQNNLILDI